MIKQHYKIKGLKGYVFSKPTKDKAPKTEAQSIQVAKNRVYSNGEGLFAPGRQIKGTIRGAMSLTKMKIERSNKRAIDLMNAVLEVEPNEMSFDLPFDSIEIAEGLVHLDMGKIKWAHYAYLVPGWELEFDLVFHEMLEPDFIKEALEMAGLLCGIGGKRNLGFGRFELG